MIYEVKGTAEVKKIFSGWQETMIQSCLQGIMGHLYADRRAQKTQLNMLTKFILS